MAILPITLYDSYLKKLFQLKPDETVVQDTLKLYSCGPTVYYYMHIGNMRAAWLPDTISKAAKLAGWKVQWVLNITDVGHLVDDGDHGEDKLEKGAKREGKTVQQIVDYYTEDYLQQASALNIDIPVEQFNPKASDYIQSQMIVALELLKLGYAYLLEDGIYFDSLASQEVTSDLNNLPGFPRSHGNSNYTGRDIANTEKHAEDFALWKFVEANSLQKWTFQEFPEVKQFVINLIADQGWSSDGFLEELDKGNLPPIFRYLDKNKAIQFSNSEAFLNIYGCPGWHSECVAMICEILGEGVGKNGMEKYLETIQLHLKKPVTQKISGPAIIDIHTGGEDHISIHHKNEILQSKALGFELSKYWVHNKFVMVDGKKMAKSDGNVYQAVGQEDISGFPSLLESGYDPLAYRLLMFEHSYTDQLNFTWDKLTQAQNRLHNLRKEAAKLLSYWNYKYGGVPLESPLYQTWLETLMNNLDTPKFLEIYQAEIAKEVNSIGQYEAIGEMELYNLIKFDADFLQLNLFQANVSDSVYSEVWELGVQRKAHRDGKDFKKGDRARQAILDLGYQIDDYTWGFGIWWKG